MVQALCQQHGPINRFVPNNANRSQVLVSYARAEDATKAQRALNMCPLAGTQIVAELVGGDIEAARLLEGGGLGAVGPVMSGGGVGRMMGPPGGSNNSGPFQPPNLSSLGGIGGFHGGMPRSPAPPHMMGGGGNPDWSAIGGWGGGSAAGGSGGGGMMGGGNLWGGNNSDHGSSFLPNDLLGGQ